MSRFNNTKDKRISHLLVYTLLVVVTVAIIVFFLPRNSGPQFRYDIGKPWMYSPLIAKFDFPIYKTEAAIKMEQDSVANSFEPYFNYNSETGQKQIKRFLQKYKDGIPGLTVPAHRSIIVQSCIEGCLEINFQRLGIMIPDIRRDLHPVIRKPWNQPQLHGYLAGIVCLHRPACPLADIPVALRPQVHPAVLPGYLIHS